MPYVKVDIAGGQVSGVDSLSSAASFVDNFEVDEAGINHVRPPLQLINYDVAAPVNGLSAFGDWLVASYDGTDEWRAFYALDYTRVLSLNDTTQASKLTGNGRGVFVQGADYLYATKGDRPRRWRYVFGGANIAEELTQAPTCTHLTIFGQRLVANDDSDPNTYRWSDIGEGVWDTWPSSNVASAESTADAIVALDSTADMLWIWGGSSVELYTLTDDPDLPFGRIGHISVGLAAPYAYCRIDDAYVWLDERKRIVRSSGQGYEVLSDAIQRDLRNIGGLGASEDIRDCWMYRESRGQFDLLVVRFPSAEKTYVLNLKSNAWSERSMRSDGNFRDDYVVGAATYWPAQGIFVQALADAEGGIYYYSPNAIFNWDSVVRDIFADKAAVAATRTTGWSDFGTVNKKRYGRIRAVLRRGQTFASDFFGSDTTTDAFEIRYQDDDGPWSEWESVVIGPPSSYEHVVDIYTAGIGRRRRYEVRYGASTLPTAFAELYQDVVADLGV